MLGLLNIDEVGPAHPAGELAVVEIGRALENMDLATVLSELLEGRAVEVKAEDPAAMGARWAEVLGAPSRGGSSGSGLA